MGGGEEGGDCPLIGIYVGNTNSCVAAWLNGRSVIIYTDYPNWKTCSDIAFTAIGFPDIGTSTRRFASSITAVKRLIGLRFDNPFVQKHIWPFKVVEGDDGGVRIVVENNRKKKLYSPKELLAIILSRLMVKLKERFNCSIKHVTLTIPAYFNNSQLQAMKDAAVLAKVDVLHIVDEPIAILFAFGFERKYIDNQITNVMVLQTGGYTISATIVNIQNSVMKIKATTTNIEFGGNNFNDLMVESMLDKFKHDKNMDSKALCHRKRKLWQSIEHAKITTNAAHPCAKIEISLHDNKKSYEELDHSSLEHWSKGLFEKLKELVFKCFRKAEMEWDQICDVVLVGGTSKMPMLRNMLQEFFHGKELHYHPLTEAIVACGATILGAKLSNEKDEWTANGRNGALRIEESKLLWESEGEEDEIDGPVIGIDFGTSNSCVSVWEKGRAEIIINNEGNRITPSYVSFNDNDEILVGDAAKNDTHSAQRIVFGVKRLIGKKFNEISNEEMKSLPFEITEEDNEPRIIVEYKGEKKLYPPHHITSMILVELKKYAENKLNQGPIKNIVVTVPAYFGNLQRKAMNAAAAKAGFNILRVVNEPTAAAVAFGLEQKYNCRQKKIVLVFDLGGGTLDVSLLEIQNNNIQVKATDGDIHMGGEDFDNRLVEYLTKRFESRQKVDISNNKRSKMKLRKACEEAKKLLSVEGRFSVTVQVESLYKGIDFREVITRAKFEDINEDLLVKCMEPVKKCLAQIRMKKEEVDDVVLVGGSSRIPKIRDLLQEFFNGKGLCCTFHPVQAVAYGAAILGAKLGAEEDESLKDFDLKDATLVSLGVEDKDGKMLVVVPRNTPYPVTKKIKYHTFDDNQTLLCFKVYEGERKKAKDNNLLGSFNLEGISPGHAGAVAVELTFKVDINGMVQATAMDSDSGRTAGISITDKSGRLDNKQIDEMLQEVKKAKSNEQRFARKFKVKLDLENYAEFVSNILRERNLTSKLGEYMHDYLSYASSRALQWSKSKGPETKTVEFIKTTKSLKTALKPYTKDIGVDN